MARPRPWFLRKIGRDTCEVVVRASGITVGKVERYSHGWTACVDDENLGTWDDRAEAAGRVYYRHRTNVDPVEPPNLYDLVKVGGPSGGYDVVLACGDVIGHVRFEGNDWGWIALGGAASSGGEDLGFRPSLEAAAALVYQSLEPS